MVTIVILSQTSFKKHKIHNTFLFFLIEKIRSGASISKHRERDFINPTQHTLRLNQQRLRSIMAATAATANPTGGSESTTVVNVTLSFLLFTC